MSRAKKCNFGDLLDDLIVDRIIFGIKDDQLRTKLLDIDPLSLHKISTLCRSAESCKEQSQIVTADSLLQTVPTSSISAIKTPLSTAQQINQPRSYPCRNCGSTHPYRQCPAFGKSCSSCSKPNHFAAQCRSRSSFNAPSQRKPSSLSNTTPPTKSVPNTTKKVAELNIDDPDSNAPDELYVNEIRAAPLSDVLYVNTIEVLSLNSSSDTEDDWFEMLILQGRGICLKLDSGAQCNVLPLQAIKNSSLKILPSHVRRIASYSDTSFKLPVLGEVRLSAKFQSRPNKLYQLSFLIVEENVAPILGRKSCVACGFLKRIHHLQTESWADIRATFKSLFSGLGYVPAFPYDAVLVDNPQLTIYPARRIPFKLMEPVKAELDQMEHLKVI